MTKARFWGDLTHEKRIELLTENSVEQLADEYQLKLGDRDALLRVLHQERDLWLTLPTTKEAKHAGEAPNKEVVLGAYRDLDRAEALLELIDNSIDAWKLRRKDYPTETARNLVIRISISNIGVLLFEDNAGGIPEAKLPNLVVPGQSSTEPSSATIGSYKTGGKKAIFRLALAVNLATRYWNPAGSSDEAFSIHLDDKWLKDVNLYEFPYFRVTDKSAIEKGQTRYRLQLRNEPEGTPWFQNPDQIASLKAQIVTTYSLLLVRNPSIKITFNEEELKPSFEMYDFTGMKDSKGDLQPQRVSFTTKLSWEGIEYDVEIEIVMGLRVTSGGNTGNKGPGLDFYGNDRLYRLKDESLYLDHGSGQWTGLVRGFINVRGPNVFVPWDTHKRHINFDRDVFTIIRDNQLIRSVIKNWTNAAKAVATFGRGEIKDALGKAPYKELIKAGHADLNLPHSATVAITRDKRRSKGLPDTVFKPKARPPKASKESTSVTMSITLTRDDAVTLAEYGGFSSKFDGKKAKQDVSDFAKAIILSYIGKARKPRKTKASKKR